MVRLNNSFYLIAAAVFDSTESNLLRDIKFNETDKPSPFKSIASGYIDISSNPFEYEELRFLDTSQLLQGLSH